MIWLVLERDFFCRGMWNGLERGEFSNKNSNYESGYENKLNKKNLRVIK